MATWWVHSEKGAGHRFQRALQWPSFDCWPAPSWLAPPHFSCRINTLSSPGGPESHLTSWKKLCLTLFCSWCVDFITPLSGGNLISHTSKTFRGRELHMIQFFRHLWLYPPALLLSVLYIFTLSTKAIPKDLMQCLIKSHCLSIQKLSRHLIIFATKWWRIIIIFSLLLYMFNFLMIFLMFLKPGWKTIHGFPVSCKA